MEVVDLISHFSYTFIKGLLNKNCPHTNTLKLWFYNFAKTSINFFAKLTLTISQELSRIDEDFLCAIARIWQWRHPAVLAVCRLYPTYKVTKNLGPKLSLLAMVRIHKINQCDHIHNTAFLSILWSRSILVTLYYTYVTNFFVYNRVFTQPIDI